MSSFVLTSLSKSDVVRPGPDSEEGGFGSKDRRTTIDRNFVDVIQPTMLLHVGNVFKPFFLDLLHLSDLVLDGGTTIRTHSLMREIRKNLG